MRKALAMGADRGVHVTDPALAGSDAPSRRPGSWPPRSRTSSTTWSLPAPTRPTGSPGVVPAGVAALLGLPYLSYAAKIEPNQAAETVRVRRISPTGYDVLEAPMPALIVCTQALGEPRYPSLKGIMAARSKEIATKVARRHRGRRPRAVGGAVATTKVLGVEAPPPRAATRVVREAPDEAAREVVEFLAERRIV